MPYAFSPTYIADRVKETSTTVGTGTYSLAGAATGYRTFVAGIGTTQKCFYVAQGASAWEIGIGTITAGAPDTLARTTIIESSNANAAVNWSGEPLSIFCAAPALAQGGGNLTPGYLADSTKGFYAGAFVSGPGAFFICTNATVSGAVWRNMLTELSQHSTMSLLTTGATPTVMNNTASGSGTPLNAATEACAFSALITARNTSTNDSKAWKIEGCAKQIAGTVSLVGAPIVTVLGADAGAAAWTAAAVAGTGVIDFQATGVAATNIQWDGRVVITEA